MKTDECLQCGTAMTGVDCETCESAGKTEVIAMVAFMALIALTLVIYTSTKLM